MRVTNMTNDSGKSMPNQYIVMNKGCRYFQSYNAVIVEIDENGDVYLDSQYWDYSKTTAKYRNKFLGLDKQEILDRVATGEIKFKNLN